LRVGPTKGRIEIVEITLTPELEQAAIVQAERAGVSTQELVLEILHNKLLCDHAASKAALVPNDEWERELISAAVDCGVSLADDVLSSEGLYE